jgi:hypothetical protein
MVSKSEALAAAHRFYAECIAAQAEKKNHPEVFNAVVEALSKCHQQTVEYIHKKYSDSSKN